MKPPDYPQVVIREKYSVGQLTQRLGWSRPIIRDLIEAGRIRAVDTTPGSKYRRWYVTEEAVQAYLRGETSPRR